MVKSTHVLDVSYYKKGSRVEASYKLTHDMIALWSMSSIAQSMDYRFNLEDIKQFIADIPLTRQRMETVQEFIDRYIQIELKKRMAKRLALLKAENTHMFLTNFDLKYKVFDLVQFAGLVERPGGVYGVSMSGGSEVFVFNVVLPSEPTPEGWKDVVVTCGDIVNKVIYNPVLLEHDQLSDAVARITVGKYQDRF